MVLPDFDFGSPFDPRILEESDTGLRGLFQSFVPAGASRAQQDQFSGLFQPTFNRFLGQLGRMFAQGQTPDLSFSDALNDRAFFDPQRELNRFAPRDRGGPTIFQGR